MERRGARRRVVLAVAAAAAVASVVAAPAASATGRTQIQLQDRCDPATFNPVGEALGVGPICFKNGGVTFDEFADRLNLQDGGHHGWRFSREDTHIDRGQSLRISNVGGEFHSFTEVLAFGQDQEPPGAEILNNAVPETTLAVPADPAHIDATFVAPAGLGLPTTLNVSGLARGTHKFQCFIHPWMRAVVVVG